MTLLITVFAAIVSTLIWYVSDAARILKTGFLSLMLWGASLMWLVDAIVEYTEVNADFFLQEPRDMLNDAFLGFSVVALALIIWLIAVLVSDPKGTVHKMLKGK